MPVHVGLPAATSATTSFADGSFVTPSSSLAMPPPATARQAIGHTATTQAPSLPPISTGVASSPATAGGLSSTSPFGAGTFTGHHAGAAGSSIAALLSTVTSTSDPVLRQAIERTMEQTLAELRSPDRARRQLMLVEIAARQLAVHIAEYEAEVARQQQQPAARAAPGGGGTAGAGAGGAAD